MTSQISITGNSAVQLQAAKSLSKELAKLDIKHAFIGSFALSLCGGSRKTEDIDILIDILSQDIQAFLRPEISRLNPHFSTVGLKYYFAPSLITGVQGEALIQANNRNVLIETLPTKNLGLPPQAGPTFLFPVESDDHKLPVLHLSVLILTKMKRWKTVSESTRPQSQIKAFTDKTDIRFLINWLKDRNITISFSEYNSEHPERLDLAVKAYTEHVKESGTVEELNSLKKVIAPEDQKRLFG